MNRKNILPDENSRPAVVRCNGEEKRIPADASHPVCSRRNAENTEVQCSLQRVYRLQDTPEFMSTLAALEEAEQDRVFCRHTLDHFLDVARLMYIEDLERSLGIRKDVIYGAALLHDLGRLAQIREGIPHDEAGAALAEKLLPACGYTETEIREIRDAILAHRGDGRTGEGLGGLLYRADKASRNCFHCRAAKECNWSEEKRNRYVR